eukprot:gene28331-31451_t
MSRVRQLVLRLTLFDAFLRAISQGPSRAYCCFLINGTPKGDKKSSASSGGDDAPSGFMSKRHFEGLKFQDLREDVSEPGFYEDEMSKRQFEELRFQNLREDVSEPGFNEDEVIPLYEDNLDDGMGDDAACNDGSMVEPREREQETKKKGAHVRQ